MAEGIPMASHSISISSVIVERSVFAEVRSLLASAVVAMAISTTVVPSLLAQGPPKAPAQIGPTLKVEVGVVLLDVVVTNKKGEPVSGLAKDQFDVTEDGVPQAVSFFEEHVGAQQPASRPGTPGPLPANVFTSSQTIKPSESVNVLLLDWLNTQPADQAYVRKQVIKYLRTVPPGTRLAIFALGTELRLVQGFTTESSVILAALNDKAAGANPKSAGLLDSKTREASEQEVIDLMIRNDAAPEAVSALRDSMNEATARQTGSRVSLTIQGLLELQRYLSPIPGRKNVFWFSGSFPVRTIPGTGPRTSHQGDSQQAAQDFGPARIAIYPISAEGVTSGSGGVLMDPSQGLTTRVGASNLSSGGDTSDSAKQIAMESIARQTGGEAFYNTNELDHEITRAVEDGAHYYTIAYTPTNAAKDGKFRSIQVKLTKGNYKLSYRRGYTETPKSEQAASQAPSDRLLDLMRFGMPDYDQIAYNVRVAPEDPQPPAGSARAGANQEMKGPVTRYSVDYSIPLAALKLTPDADGGKHGTLKLMLVAYEKNGHPLNLVESKNEYSLKREVYESARNVNIHARQELDVPEGSVYLRVGLYEQASGNVGTIEVPLNAAVAREKVGASPGRERGLNR